MQSWDSDVGLHAHNRGQNPGDANRLTAAFFKISRLMIEVQEDCRYWRAGLGLHVFPMCTAVGCAHQGVPGRLSDRQCRAALVCCLVIKHMGLPVYCQPVYHQPVYPGLVHGDTCTHEHYFTAVTALLNLFVPISPSPSPSTLISSSLLLTHTHQRAISPQA